MSDQVSSASDSSQMTALLAPMSAGSLLRSAREAEGLHIAALAVSLKVPVNKIEAIEADRLDLLPDIVFARALAASMCRALKIDSSPVLEKMPSSSVPFMKTDESGINTPYRAPGEVSSFKFWTHLSKPVALAVMVLLVGALILLLTPFLPKIADLEAVLSSPSETGPLQSTAPALPEGEAQAGSVAALPVTALVNSNGLPIAPAESDNLSSNPVTPSEASSPTVDGSGLVTGLLVLNAKEASWVQVVDAAGVVHIRKTLSAGDAVGVSGVLPLSVVLGRADAVDVQVKGQPFDTSAKTKENIARFEVR